MLQPPPLKSVLRYPVTAGIAAAAIAVTGLWWTGSDVMEWAGMDLRVWYGWQIWRGLTCTLPHVNFFHLAFNLYWWWAFGTFVERIYGHLKFIGLFALLALSSSLAEFTVFHGGVGLSGVGYGLWAMLWVLQGRDPRFGGVIDRRTSELFIGWFFLCVVLTLTDVMPVGNVAHGAGAITGALLGLAMSTSGIRKHQSVVGLVFLLVLGLAGSMELWPWTSFSKYKGEALAYAGSEALGKADYAKARKWLEMAVRRKTADAIVWFDLGIVYHHLGRYTDALTAYEKATQCPGATDKMRQAARAMKDYESMRRQFRLSN